MLSPAASIISSQDEKPLRYRVVPFRYARLGQCPFLSRSVTFFAFLLCLLSVFYWPGVQRSRKSYVEASWWLTSLAEGFPCICWQPSIVYRNVETVCSGFSGFLVSISEVLNVRRSSMLELLNCPQFLAPEFLHLCAPESVNFLNFSALELSNDPKH